MAFEDIVRSLIGGGGHQIRVLRAGPATRARLAVRLLNAGRNVALVTRDLAETNECRALMRLFSPELSATESPITQPLWEQPLLSLPEFPVGGRGRAAWSERLAALYALQRNSSRLGVLLPLSTFLPLLPPLNFFASHELRLAKGMDMAPDLVLEQAVDWGYTRVPMVSAPGEAAMRGDILDLYCPGYARPLRLEFFGDTLDDIRLFEATTQRSVADISEVTLLPVTPVIREPGLHKAAQARWKKLSSSFDFDSDDLRGLERAYESGGTDLMPGMFYPDAGTLEQWLPPKSILLLPGEQDLAEGLESLSNAWAGHLDDVQEATGLRQPLSLTLRSVSQTLADIGRHDRAHFEELVMGLEKNGEDLPERAIHSFQELFPAPGDVDRPWHRLVAAMREWSAGPGQVVLAFASARSRAKFLALAEQDGIRPHLRYVPDGKGLYALIAPFRSGVQLGWDAVLVLGEDVLQPRADRAARKSPGSAFQGLDRYDELQEGDYLVHRDYGIGCFGGLHRMQLGGVENDFLLLSYAGDAKLYLPVDRLDLIQRYKAPDGAEPVPDKLGGSQWAAGKDKARKAIEKIAEDLVQMYAYRKVAKGFHYLPVSEMYREFEATFGFEETPDQARAIQDVLEDMEKPEPMDRLVCGDVGFGKTEVALRAAFRAVLEGRQVALLCPTTVLAEQHYQTFRARLAGFPVHVGMLSRFVSAAKQKEVLAAAAKGQVDILIGTHRLLSKDVVLPNLGLMVLDEEQRFGVRHKERLKELRKNVDALTLTATPIPRTLQLSLSGIRELSVIETAPPDRKPVSTAIINRDEATLKAILERELARNGQVFWVYNRVQGLERVVEFVKKLAPGARVGMAHGQMAERALEDTMHKFWHGELDVLVCTAIIESGLDFPKANTLIVDQAQMFGLGQLYQLRGRVGRSDRQAFAVFVVPDVDRLPENSRQRLRIILDLDFLGAGFQVAMEDLRLRGAGNILGESQSGHMTRLGLDLFLEMLEEAVAKLKGEERQEEIETELTLGIAAHIPDSYIADARERLKYYKSLSSAVDAAARQDIEFELRDRFGPWPEQVGNFLAVISFKRFLNSIGVHKADIHPERLRLSFVEKRLRLDPAKLVAWATQSGGQARLLPPSGLEMLLASGPVAEQLEAARNRLSALAPDAP